MGGLIHPLPRHGMCYTPLCGVNACDGGDDTASLVARCDVILHKATDQLQVDVCPGHALRFTRAFAFSLSVLTHCRMCT